jgi:hypothetical protein
MVNCESWLDLEDNERLNSHDLQVVFGMILKFRSWN